MKVNYTEVSEYLKLERFKKKVSQDKIAEFIGISGNTYRSYENNPETITLDDISENVGLSRYYVSRILNQGEGKNLTALVNQLRIEKAKSLLLDGRKSNEVAYMLGYQDPSYFSKVFKKLTGQSPKEFIETN